MEVKGFLSKTESIMKNFIPNTKYVKSRLTLQQGQAELVPTSQLERREV